MMDLTDDVVECVLAKARTGDVPEDIVRAADILKLMIERELERRVQAGKVIAHVGADGETYYGRADD